MAVGRRRRGGLFGGAGGGLGGGRGLGGDLLGAWRRLGDRSVHRESGDGKVRLEFLALDERGEAHLHATDGVGVAEALVCEVGRVLALGKG